MNPLEREMVDMLVDLKEHHHAISVKAEFESEGARVDEVLRLKEIASQVGLGFTLTIGGCEALYDLHQVRLIGASRIVGPMIESPYALKKLLSSVRRVFSRDEREGIMTWINVETIDACNALDRMLALPEINGLSGIVMGRVDLLGSLGLDRDSINSPEILHLARELFTKAKQNSLKCGIGGGVTAQALPFMREIGVGLLDHYETSKVLFECPGALGQDAELGIAKALGFELLWLKNKRNYYREMFTEDDQRIQMMEARRRAAIEAARI
jgi:hypothetical protein